MTTGPVTELGGGGALRLPHARVVPLSASPTSYTAAVERYLTGAGIAKSSARIYRISLTTWGWMLAGEPAPTGPARRGAKPPVFLVTAIEDPTLPEALAENQIAALWRLDVSLREKTFWKMLYESAARADEVLCRNAEDLYRMTIAAGSPPRAGRRSGLTGSPAPPNSCPG
ncbi:hypothetical protein ABZ921_32685 [Streptomyces atriruber]|uniref:Uncharacterized protein n=1 Tax=Streptomyces atriruber TaxID=545121 RepID=A0ABV3BXD6_9ACTN